MFRSHTSIDALFDLIARKKYGKAIAIVREELAERPDNIQLRMQLADLLVLAQEPGGAEEATGVLARLADELAAGGFVAKAIAVVKKMQRIDPGRPGLEARLARLAERRQDELSGVRPAVPVVKGSSAESSERDDLESESKPKEGLSHSPLDRSQLFRDFSTDELTAVIRGLDLLTFEPGTILFTEGESGESLMVLASGSVRVFVKDGDGRNREVRRLEAGEVFGEISLLTDMPRTATITAAEACEVLELDRSAVAVIAEDHPKVREILRELCLARAGSDEEMALRASS